MNQKQRTVKQEVIFEGIGVHNGIFSRLIVKPAPSNTGIILRNVCNSTDVIHIGKIIPTESMYATVLQKEGWKVSTIEHVMAALAMLDIDNVIIELEGEEFPILDGSSLPFVEKLVAAGRIQQDAQKEFVTPREPLSFFDERDNRLLEIYPANDCDQTLYIEYEASFNEPILGTSFMKCKISEDFFIKELAPARTFGFLHQLPFMQKHGLAKGSSLENTVVISENGFINERRFEDECLRHKVLDLIGDLSLLGKKLIGTVKAKKTGHSFNRRVIDHFVNNPHLWMAV